MIKWSLSFGTRIVGSEKMVVGFLTISRRVEEKFSLVRIKVPPERRINDKATYHVIINSNGLKFGTPSTLAKKLHSFGQFGIMRWRSMNGGHALPRPPF